MTQGMHRFPVWEHDIYPGMDLEPLDRMQGRDGVDLVEANVTNIDVKVFLVPDKTAVLSQLALSPSAGVDPGNRVFDTLQTDGRWILEGEGYNSRQLITYAALVALEGGKVYMVEIRFDTTQWNDLYAFHQYTVIPTWSQV